MSWFRVDDKSAFHRKTLAAGNQAWGALMRAGAWCCDHATDGTIHTTVATIIEPDSCMWSRLEEVGLVHKTLDGWQIHDFLDYNMSAKDVEKSRKVRALAGSKGGKQKASKALANATPLASGLLTTGASKPLPHPDPIPIPEISPKPPRGGNRKRRGNETTCPATGSDWTEWAERWGLTEVAARYENQFQKFLNHHRSRESYFVDWKAVWGTWEQNAIDYGHIQKPSAPVDPAESAAEQARLERVKRELRGQDVRQPRAMVDIAEGQLDLKTIPSPQGVPAIGIHGVPQ